MMEPRKNYSNSEKFMRGVEKVRPAGILVALSGKVYGIKLFCQLGGLYSEKL